MSGTLRPPWFVYWLAWLAGLAGMVQLPPVSYGVIPPPPPTHASSWLTLPLSSAMTVVPPAAVVHVPSAGQLVPGPPPGTPVEATSGQKEPLSPVDANIDWPCSAPSSRDWSVVSIAPSTQAM